MGFMGANYSGYNGNFYEHISRFIGQTVTIFTTSGGASGCGFTGVILSVNCDYVRLASRQGTPPANPLSETICPRKGGAVGGAYTDGYDDTLGGQAGCSPCPGLCPGPGPGPGPGPIYNVGSICDIPLCRIAAFCHNAV